MGLDVVSGGEMGMAYSVGFPMNLVYFHGNNKSKEELERALEWGVGRIVVDNFYELNLLQNVAESKGKIQEILLRLSPGIDPKTHKYISTGAIDSKFGFPLGQWEKAVETALSSPALHLIGLHFHLGSSIYEVEPYRQAISIVMEFASEMEKKYDFQLQEFSPGGGFAISYTIKKPAPPISYYAEGITSTFLSYIQGMKKKPKLVLEPGRAIIGQAGVALYKVGGRKEIPQVRHYIFIDGGIGDNIRPPLYGAEYEALIANRADQTPSQRVSLGGKFCEMGDILIYDIDLPPVHPGDIIAVPGCGAYCLPLSSNYNVSPRPAVLIVKDGEAKLIRRRESLEDLMALDIV